MNKDFCDKCGKEIKGETSITALKQYEYFDGNYHGRRTIDLCTECSNKLRKIIKLFMK